MSEYGARASGRRCGRILLTTLTVVLYTGGIALAGAPALVAPIYSGAVPAVQGHTPNDYGKPATIGKISALPCGEHTWCFLSKDPIGEVKAFYDKTLSPMRTLPAQAGERSYEVIAQEMTLGEMRDFAGVSVHALPPPPKITGEGMARGEAYKNTRHFGDLAAGVAWMPGMMTATHTPHELDVLYAKHRHLESAFFVHDADHHGRSEDDLLHDKYQELGVAQRSAAMQSMSAPTMPSAEMQARQRQQSKEDDAEMQRLMKRKPKLARKLQALSEQIQTAAARGDYQEAARLGKQMNKLAQSDPEVAAYMKKVRERDAAQNRATQQGYSDAQSNMVKGLGQANWGPWVKYLKALEPKAYRTLIVIQERLRADPKYPAPVVTDRATIARDAVNAEVMPQDDWGLHLDEGAMNAQASTARQAPQPEAKPAPPQPQDKRDADLQKAAKKGLNMLKKLF